MLGYTCSLLKISVTRLPVGGRGEQENLLLTQRYHMWQKTNIIPLLISGLIRLVIFLECFIEITPDFLCSFMND